MWELTLGVGLLANPMLSGVEVKACIKNYISVVRMAC